ncbi:hypothetical protein Joe_55 [Streptomyces phage Joe]|uniref:Transglycosylase SLT domain-containing protein n=1 Tax=Streptomyces phage Joe TaxID=1913034 RepID=A0A1J0GQA6_9CAUD|nr:hypothetical protein KGG94_gp55 [Streptomyces phage Joe]APC43295.1 hypothetical protein Joe_55 [Streptomyces phage Joe]
MAAGVTALTSALSLGLLGGAVLVDKVKADDPTPIHDTQPIPTVTATVTVTPKPTPTKPKPKPSETRASRSATRLQTPREIGRELAAERGWVGAEWTALEDLWTRESSWNPDAQNPTSTAYGIAQFLDSTWAGYGIAKTSDARLQIKAGLRYIAARYGTPSNALAFWLRQSPHWY